MAVLILVVALVCTAAGYVVGRLVPKHWSAYFVTLILGPITGVATFMASAGAGLLWMVGGAALACGAGASIGSAALAMLLFRCRCRLPQ